MTKWVNHAAKGVQNVFMDKPQLTRQNLGRVFNSRSGCMCPMHCYEANLSNLKLQTQPKQLLDYTLAQCYKLSTSVIYEPL
jgi:hypothetical protein